MDRFTISKTERQSIYEIYRACRLCGAGGGYKMPIIQNIIDLDGSELELKQKIQECTQLEIRHDDRMPPLICELCVDKVNDFYTFLEMCRQTNKRTRMKLGLPLQTVSKGSSESGDCILGVTEPVFNTEEEERAKRKNQKAQKKDKKEIVVKREPVANTPRGSRSSSASSRTERPTPPRRPEPRAKRPPPVTQEKTTKKAISEKELKDLMQNYDENSLLMPRSHKRVRETDIPKPVLIPVKKSRLKETVPEKDPSPPPQPKPGPKSRTQPQKPSAPSIPKAAPKSTQKQVPNSTSSPSPEKNKSDASKTKSDAKKVKSDATNVKSDTPKVNTCCVVCKQAMKTVKALSNHLRKHVPNYTNIKYACNPCGLWFPTIEEASCHHRYHRASTFPYHCRRCFEDYSLLEDYDEHIEKNECMPWQESPDVKCEECWRSFPTEPLRAAHRCAGEEGRPGGKCPRCSKNFATVKTLRKHESSCTYRKRSSFIADPDILRRLKPMQVRVARCDDLVSSPDGRCDVSGVRNTYGLDRKYLYPYLPRVNYLPIKAEVLEDAMVAIKDEVKKEFDVPENYKHWDSDSDSDVRSVDSLSTLSIKKIFSKSLLGKVKKRKVDGELFDSLNESGFGNMTADINNIINNLDDSIMDGNETEANEECEDLNETAGNDETNASGGLENKNDSDFENDESANVNETNSLNVHVDRNTNEILKHSVDDDDNEILDNEIDSNKSDINVIETANVSNAQIGNNTNEQEQTILNEDSLDNRTDNSVIDNRLNSESDVDNIETAEILNSNHENNIDRNNDDSKTGEESQDSTEVNENGVELNHEAINDSNSTNEDLMENNHLIKESPIKHSIDNLIGENDSKDPDKYISEVISSIEDIIMKNPRSESENVNGHEDKDEDKINDIIMKNTSEENENINGHKDNINGNSDLNNGDSVSMDNSNCEKDSREAEKSAGSDKITLEDLLPASENKDMELDDISDDEFNFDS